MPEHKGALVHQSPAAPRGRSLVRFARAFLLAGALGIGASGLSVLPAADPSSVSAASCVRFSASNFDAYGNDHYNLNGEWVRIKNYCSTSKLIGYWKIHDYGRKHVFTFPSGFRVGAYASVTLYTGYGTNTAAKRYWRRSSAVWNNTPPEYAYLRNQYGTLMSRRTEY